MWLLHRAFEGVAAHAEQKCDAIVYGRAIGARDAGSDLDIYPNSKNAEAIGEKTYEKRQSDIEALHGACHLARRPVCERHSWRAIS